MERKDRILAIDPGKVRVGLAVSDALGFTAQRLPALRWNERDPEGSLARLAEVCREKGAVRVIVGSPRRTDGREGEAESRSARLAHDLSEATGLPVELRDERYTTVLAQQVLRDTGVRADRKSGLLDSIAAEILLQEYLEALRRAGGRPEPEP